MANLGTIPSNTGIPLNTRPMLESTHGWANNTNSQAYGNSVWATAGSVTQQVSVSHQSQCAYFVRMMSSAYTTNAAGYLMARCVVWKVDTGTQVWNNEIGRIYTDGALQHKPLGGCVVTSLDASQPWTYRWEMQLTAVNANWQYDVNDACNITIARFR